MKELSETKPMVFVVTTFIIAQIYGLAVAQDLVGHERLIECVSRCLKDGEEHLTKSIQDALAKLNSINISMSPIESSLPIIELCAKEIAHVNAA